LFDEISWVSGNGDGFCYCTVGNLELCDVACWVAGDRDIVGGSDSVDGVVDCFVGFCVVAPVNFTHLMFTKKWGRLGIWQSGLITSLFLLPQPCFVVRRDRFVPRLRCRICPVWGFRRVRLGCLFAEALLRLRLCLCSRLFRLRLWC